MVVLPFGWHLKMARNEPRRRGVCAICGRIAALTRDHLPPKGLFDSPLPVDLLTVQACASCNGQSNGDDEYFRNMIAMSEYRGNSSRAIAASEAAIRSIRRSNRHKNELRNTLKNVVQVDDVGNVVSNRLATNVDAERMSRVIVRICRGIFFLETGRVMNNGIEITVDVPETFDSLDNETQALMTKQLLIPLKTVKENIFAETLFRYKFQNPDPSTDTSVWWMVFYNTLPVLCMAGDTKNMAEQNHAPKSAIGRI